MIAALVYLLTETVHGVYDCLTLMLMLMLYFESSKPLKSGHLVANGRFLNNGRQLNLAASSLPSPLPGVLT